MAMWIFTKSIIAGEPIKLFNNGDMKRDFTYVDDVVEPIVRLNRPATGHPILESLAGSRFKRAPWRIYNIGNNNPVELLEVVSLLEAGHRQKGQARTVAHAAWRRTGDLCGYRRSHARCRFPSGHADRRGHLAVCRLVPHLSPPMS